MFREFTLNQSLFLQPAFYPDDSYAVSIQTAPLGLPGASSSDLVESGAERETSPDPDAAVATGTAQGATGGKSGAVGTTRDFTRSATKSAPSETGKTFEKKEVDLEDRPNQSSLPDTINGATYLENLFSKGTFPIAFSPTTISTTAITPTTNLAIPTTLTTPITTLNSRLTTQTPTQTPTPVATLKTPTQTTTSTTTSTKTNARIAIISTTETTKTIVTENRPIFLFPGSKLNATTSPPTSRGVRIATQISKISPLIPPDSDAAGLPQNSGHREKKAKPPRTSPKNSKKQKENFEVLGKNPETPDASPKSRRKNSKDSRPCPKGSV